MLNFLVLISLELLALGIACPSTSNPTYTIDDPEHRTNVIKNFSDLLETGRFNKTKRPVPWYVLSPVLLAHLLGVLIAKEYSPISKRNPDRSPTLLATYYSLPMETRTL